MTPGKPETTAEACRGSIACSVIAFPYSLVVVAVGGALFCPSRRTAEPCSRNATVHLLRHVPHLCEGKIGEHSTLPRDGLVYRQTAGDGISYTLEPTRSGGNARYAGKGRNTKHVDTQLQRDLDVEGSSEVNMW